MDRRLAVLLLVYWFGQNAYCLPVTPNMGTRSTDSSTSENIENIPVDISTLQRDSSSTLNAGDTEEFYRSINADANLQLTTVISQVNPDIDDGTFQGTCYITFNVNVQTEQVYLAIDGLYDIEIKLVIGNSLIEQDVEIDDEGDKIAVSRPGEDQFGAGVNHRLIINYHGEISNDGIGVYMGSYGGNTYVGINPYPDHIYKIMPYPGDSVMRAAFQFVVDNPGGFSNPISNMATPDGNPFTFEQTQEIASHSAGLFIHDMETLFAPEHIKIIGRNGISDQVSYASIMSGLIMENMGEITGKEFPYIVEGNDLNIVALPDVVRESATASVVPIWEPYLMMAEQGFAEIQKETILKKLATEMTKQWFHVLVSPSNLQYMWVGYGLSVYYGYVVANEADEDLNVADHFLVDIMQAALLMDSQPGVEQMRPDDPVSIDDEADNILQGTIRLRAPAIISMVENVIGREALDKSIVDLLNIPFEVFNENALFIPINDNKDPENHEEMETIQMLTDDYVYSSGYPVITVEMSDTMEISVTQYKFGLEGLSDEDFVIPLSWTTKSDADFEDTGHKEIMYDKTIEYLEDLSLEEDEWIIFNIQQKDYYRVNYDEELWERLIAALSDEETRDDIHRANRAQIVDDAMNLARADVIDYTLSMEVLATMLIEEDYLVWRAVVPSLRFLKATLGGDEDGPDLYRAYVRSLTSTVLNTVSEFEDDVSHEEHLLRALIYELSCEADSGVCLDYADSYEELDEVPAAHRPAVYCTKVRGAEDDKEVMEELWDKYGDEDVLHEKLVILKALGCSGDEEWINDYFERTIEDSDMLASERVHAFKGIIEGHENNVEPAFEFLQDHLDEILDKFGGEWFVGEIIVVLGEFMADTDMSFSYTQWLNNNEDALGASVNRVREYVRMTRVWRNNNLEEVMEVIQDAIDQLPDSSNTFGASVILACLVTFIARFVY